MKIGQAYQQYSQKPCLTKNVSHGRREYGPGFTPSGFLSKRSSMFSPMLRIKRSMSCGLRFASAWPYQYTSGKRVFELRDMGAVVAAEPRGVAAE